VHRRRRTHKDHFDPGGTPHLRFAPRSLDKIGREVRSTNLPKNAAIVVYCGGPKCPQSRMAAEKLVKLG